MPEQVPDEAANLARTLALLPLPVQMALVVAFRLSDTLMLISALRVEDEYIDKGGRDDSRSTNRGT